MQVDGREDGRGSEYMHVEGARGRGAPGRSGEVGMESGGGGIIDKKRKKRKQKQQAETREMHISETAGRKGDEQSGKAVGTGQRRGGRGTCPSGRKRKKRGKESPSFVAVVEQLEYENGERDRNAEKRHKAGS